MVYRVLTIYMTAPGMSFRVDPYPVLTFFGQETTKELGTIKISCTPA
jgi:hypothetical protein